MPMPNTLGDFFRQQIPLAQQRSLVVADIQKIYPEFYEIHKQLLGQKDINRQALDQIKQAIGSTIGGQKQVLELHWEEIRQDGYPSANYRYFFDLVRWIVDQLEWLDEKRKELFSVLEGYEMTITPELNNGTWASQTKTRVSLHTSAPAHKKRKEKSWNEAFIIQTSDITQLMTQVGISIPQDKESAINKQINNLPLVSKKRLMDHLQLLNQCYTMKDKQRYMTKLHNGDISIKFDYENFYRLALTNDRVCIGILEKGHQYDEFIKP